MKRKLSEEGCTRLFVGIVRNAIKANDTKFIFEGNNMEHLVDMFGITDLCMNGIRNNVRRKFYAR